MVKTVKYLVDEAEYTPEYDNVTFEKTRLAATSLTPTDSTLEAGFLTRRLQEQLESDIVFGQRRPRHSPLTYFCCSPDVCRVFFAEVLLAQLTHDIV